MKILLIDNYDSFVYNIYQYLGELEPRSDIQVFRNDKITISQIKKLSVSHIIISPGPGRPKDAGISLEVVKKFSGKIPILGVCLGHQVIGEAFGGNIIHASHIVHGKTSVIHHTDTGVFKDVANPFSATRYHSLVIEEKSIPSCLMITAKSEGDDEIMGVQHKEYATFGVQFHPESILTGEGKNILMNFLKIKKAEKPAVVSLSAPQEDIMKKSLDKLLLRKDLSFVETKEIMDTIMTGRASDSQIAAFLIALRMKGETGDELAGMAKIMQDKSIRIRSSNPMTVDTCGTGGDGAGTFNISTATAFVVCAGKVPVAKHGNRSVSSKVGSADVLEAGGYNLQKSPDQMAKELEENQFSFLFAPLLHPAMKYVMPARKQLKTRTAFNLLGPVTNPARVKYQIIGVFDFDFAPKMAKALQAIGTERAVVVSGGFTDELTTCHENKVLFVTQKEIKPLQINIQKLGLKKGNRKEISGEEDPKKAFWMIQQVISGKANQTQVETVALNAGVLFWVCKKARDLKSGVDLALDLMKTQKALHKLEQVMEYQHG
ncbi:MAG: bifunctional anthranilate synthase component II/anthranilate phosphoribosyltransferase [Spirochaetes bacterium]|nr:bifunctional anthranilate synthase component II/anthranilate phosphoribosyltransferase [Spirochaetota bacterium]